MSLVKICLDKCWRYYLWKWFTSDLIAKYESALAHGLSLMFSHIKDIVQL